MVDENLARFHAIVEGRVQGVGFRFFVKEEADVLGVTGWVRNRWDDTVESTAEGERADLEKFIQIVRRGPRSAYVSQVKVDWQENKGEFGGFGIRSTY